MKRVLTKRGIRFLTVLAVIVTCNNALALEAPALTVTTSGLDVSLSWTSVSGATGYTLYYAPYPYEGEHTIGNFAMGSTSFSVTLWDGASYYVAVTAHNNTDESEFSNVELFKIETSVSEPEYDGVWVGETNQGNQITLEIIDNQISYVGTLLEAHGAVSGPGYSSSCTNYIFDSTEIEISDNKFSFSSYGSVTYDRYKISGIFENNTVSGTWTSYGSHVDCGSYSSTGTWSAMKDD